MTNMLRRCIHQLHPEDLVGLSNKVHGTSWVAANVITRKKLTWKERLAKWLGIDVVDTEYFCIASSRKVVKDQYVNEKASDGFYGYDLWSDIRDSLRSVVPKGITLYGEAVGYLPTGKMIQPEYHYGCAPGTYKLSVYRITFTNPDGKTFEFSEPQIIEFCQKYGIPHKEMFYYGKAKDLFPDLDVNNHWHENFLERLEKSFNMNDAMCKDNNYEVPAEGLILRIDSLTSFNAFKLKNFAFLGYETIQLDKGNVDIETEQSVEDDDNA